jgi:hypothetical protein
MDSEGLFYIEKGKCILRIDGQEVISINIDDIVGIGELTLEGCPVSDDYFLVIICKDKKHYEISFYHDEVLETYIRLQKIFDFKHDTGLANSTEFRSIGVYPWKIKNKPLFSLGLNGEVVLSDEVQMYLDFE